MNNVISDICQSNDDYDGNQHEFADSESSVTKTTSSEDEIHHKDTENGVFEEIDESGEKPQSRGKNKIVILFHLPKSPKVIRLHKVIYSYFIYIYKLNCRCCNVATTMIIILFFKF